ncbi:PHP domain-containing protein [Alkaliphilus crotonatoxidans]
MKLAYDLHIHSGLSPCSDDDMTPNNVVTMARLKGLDVIAITDHNATGNLASFNRVAKKQGLLMIPGVEVTTREEVHILGLFPRVMDAFNFQQVIDEALPKIKNHHEIFGKQLIYDDMDNIIDQKEHLLLSALQLSIEDTIKAIRAFKGVPIPAHINREAYSILTSLGFIPPDLALKTVEITSNCQYEELEKRHSYLKGYFKIYNSDAHQLGSISEREHYIEVKEKTSSAVLMGLAQQRGYY